MHVAHVFPPGKDVLVHLSGLLFESLTLQLIAATPVTTNTRRTVVNNERIVRESLVDSEGEPALEMRVALSLKDQLVAYQHQAVRATATRVTPAPAT